ncbi:MAG TPA: triose-phosphate isomerase [Patescibacteria group bacterium]|nr:triose-phosphate isomerase [Patescibacteria group bacterium]
MEKIITGNLKMNLLSPLEREHYLANFKKELGTKKYRNLEIVLCPPNIHLESFRKNLAKRILIGAQNIFWKKEGAFTGEISGVMIKNLGCEYVIIGHSERRKYFCETGEDVNLKITEALKIGLKPMVCVGETREEKDMNETLNIISKQLKEALTGINRTKIENITVVYEPVWSVGTDIFPTSHEIMEARLLIRKILVSMFEKKYADKVRILYGGSVNIRMAKAVCVDPGMDGVLVGRESLVPHDFLKIAEIISK